MIAKYILIIITGWGSTSSITAHEFYSLEQCKKNAAYLKSNQRDISDAYCTEK